MLIIQFIIVIIIYIFKVIIFLYIYISMIYFKQIFYNIYSNFEINILYI